MKTLHPLSFELTRRGFIAGCTAALAVGRAMLADTPLARSTAQDPRQARQILQALPAQLNAQGILGAALDPNALDEQQR